MIDQNQDSLAPPEAPISPYSARTQELIHELSEAESATDVSAREIADLKERLADALHADGLISESMQYLTDSLGTYEDYKDKRAAARLCNKLGSSKFLTNNYSASVEFFSRQSEWGQQAGNFITVAKGLLNMGIVQLLTAQTEAAVESTNLAVSALETCSGEEPFYANLFCFVNHVRGTYFLANAEFDKAKEYHAKVLAAAESQPSEEDPLTSVIFQSKTNLGICAVKEGLFKEALEHFQACKELCETPFLRAKTLYHIGEFVRGAKRRAAA